MWVYIKGRTKTVKLPAQTFDLIWSQVVWSPLFWRILEQNIKFLSAVMCSLVLILLWYKRWRNRITQAGLCDTFHSALFCALLFLPVCLCGGQCLHWQCDWNKHIKPCWAFLSKQSPWSAGWHGHSKYSWNAWPAVLKVQLCESFLFLQPSCDVCRQTFN